MAENMWEKYREEREKYLSKGPEYGKKPAMRRKQTNQELSPYFISYL